MVRKGLPNPDLAGPIFAPRQQSIQDIPLIMFEIQDGAPAYSIMMEKRLQQAREISPANFMGTITVLATNPRTGDSHHIVRLTNRWEVNYTVDLLFRDKDMYFVAFRRHDNFRGRNGQWFEFDDEVAPGFLNAQKVGLHAGHEASVRTTLGGVIPLHEMFMTFAMFEDGNTPIPIVSAGPMRVAKARAIVTFSEGLRYRCVQMLGISRMESNSLPSEIPGIIWNRMLSWQVLSDFLLDARRGFSLPVSHRNHGPEESVIRTYSFPYNYLQFEDLVGENGDILVILRRDDLLITRKNLRYLKRQRRSALFQDPGFR